MSFPDDFEMFVINSGKKLQKRNEVQDFLKEYYQLDNDYKEMLKENSVSQCKHNWKTYKGLNESFIFCSKCDCKK